LLNLGLGNPVEPGADPRPPRYGWGRCSRPQPCACLPECPERCHQGIDPARASSPPGRRISASVKADP